jgi:hypothetical protein
MEMFSFPCCTGTLNKQSTFIQQIWEHKSIQTDITFQAKQLGKVCVFLAGQIYLGKNSIIKLGGSVQD